MTTYKDILCRRMKNTEDVKAVKKINKNDNYQDKSVKAHLINSSVTRASIVSSIEQPQQPVAKKYGEILYNILYDYYKDNRVSRRHPERIGMVVDKLLESDIEELEEFMTNRLYLEDCADEIFTVLHYQLDPPIPGCYT